MSERQSSQKEADKISQEANAGSKEPDKEYAIPKTKTLNSFWRGIVDGRFYRQSPEEIEKIFREAYYSGPTLTLLNEEEKLRISERLQSNLADRINGHTRESLIERKQLYLLVPTEEIRDKIRKNGWGSWRPIPFGKDVDTAGSFEITLRTASSTSTKQIRTDTPYFIDVTNGDDFYDALLEMGGKKMEKEDKINIFQNPDIWRHSNVKIQGSRPLVPTSLEWESYFSLDDFKGIVDQTRRRTGKVKLKMLDVGGAMGIACHDAEQLDKNIEATNLTIDEEPAMYPVETVFCPAEMMPANFNENFDLIVSNVAFRYFTYKDIALKNCLKALSVGGIAILDIGMYSEMTEDDMRRFIEEIKNLRKLEIDGFLKIETNNETVLNDDYHYIPGNFPNFKIKIIKTKSLGN